MEKKKVILIADPGIDTAFAVALALHDPQLDVLGIIGSAGNVSAEIATQNIHILVNVFEPQKWPRIGSGLSERYPVDGRQLHGANGLGNIALPAISLHQPHLGDKLIAELIRLYPGEVTVICLGPVSMLVRAFDRDPELHTLIRRVVLMGGTWREPGNASVTAEFHFFCDPERTRRLFHTKLPITVIPLDASRKLVFSPTDLLNLPGAGSSTSNFLRQIVPYGIRASSNLYGIEGFHLKDVLGIVALSQPQLLSFESACADIELSGELTRGMMVIDQRIATSGMKQIDLATSVDVVGIRGYMDQILSQAK